MATVTTGLPEWRIAHTEAALSTICRTLPPNTVPCILASGGNIRSATSEIDSRAALEGRLGSFLDMVEAGPPVLEQVARRMNLLVLRGPGVDRDDGRRGRVGTQA